MSNSHLRLLDTGFADSYDTAMRRFFAPAGPEAEGHALKMRIDVAERAESYLVKADIPGARKEDIRVRIHGNVVQIDAETKREKETKGDGDRMLRSERHYGSISRTFSLAQDIDDSHAEAKYANGVLTLELPKKTSTASKQLEVR